jgi:hypothetical protein
MHGLLMQQYCWQQLRSTCCCQLPAAGLTWRRLVAHAAHVALEAPAAVLPLHEGVHVRAAPPAANDAYSAEVQPHAYQWAYWQRSGAVAPRMGTSHSIHVPELSLLMSV